MSVPADTGVRHEVVPAGHAVPVGIDAALVRSSIEPVPPEVEVVDAGELVKAAQLAEQELARLAAERAAAEQRAAQEQPGADRDGAERDGAEQPAPRTAGKPTRATPAAGGSDCGLDTSDLGSVKSHVRAAAEFLGCLFGRPSMHGVAGRAGTSDHPSGRAVDFMVDRDTGDALADCALRNRAALGITYVIWRQRINQGGGWEPMADRGGVTANHLDHVHISFGAGAGGNPGC